MPTSSAPFDEDFLKKLEYLTVVSQRLFSGQFRAERRTRKKGSGLEFADYRAYAPGDDFRYVDWRAYLRLEKLLLRLFEEEEDLPIYVFVDSSTSMAYGKPPKIDYARKVTAALCYIGLANLDRVNIISYTDGIRRELRSQRGKGRIFKIFNFLTEIVPEGETDFKEALKAFCTDTRRKGLTVLISDFFDPSGFEGGLNILRHFRHDIFVVHVISREDAEPRMRGEILVVDSERMTECKMEITPDLVSAYKEKFHGFCEAIESYCWKYQLGYVRSATDFPFEDLILKIFRQGRFLK